MVMLATLPMLADFGRVDAFAVGSLRLWALTARSGCCSMRALSERLGSARAAAHFHLLMEEIGTVWPEPFCVSPPCSPRLSHDEACFAAMIGLAGLEDRPAFDRLLSDLIPAEERERLFLSASMLGASSRSRGC
jgi:hypothetical protein